MSHFVGIFTIFMMNSRDNSQTWQSLSLNSSIINEVMALPDGNLLVHRSKNEFYYVNKEWKSILYSSHTKFQFFRANTKFGIFHDPSNQNNSNHSNHSNNSNHNQSIQIYAFNNILAEFAIFELVFLHKTYQIQMNMIQKWVLPITIQAIEDSGSFYITERSEAVYVFAIHFMDQKFHFLSNHFHFIWNYKTNEMNRIPAKYSISGCVRKCIYSAKLQSIFIFTGFKIYQWKDSEWNLLPFYLPKAIEQPVALNTKIGDFCFIVEGTVEAHSINIFMQTNTINKEIFVYDLMKNHIYSSKIILPHFSLIDTRMVITNDDPNDELLVFGYVLWAGFRHLYPQYLIQFIRTWICTEYFHLIDSHRMIHETINVDHIIEK